MSWTPYMEEQEPVDKATMWFAVSLCLLVSVLIVWKIVENF